MHRLTSIIALSIILVILFGQKAQGQSGIKPTLKIKKTKDFHFKNKRLAKNWSKAKWFNLSQIKGTDSNDYYTRVKVLYSKTGMYVLFNCGDQVLSANYHSDFKKLWKQDVVEIFIWPDESTPVYFEYELSPLNYELPILNSVRGGDHARWIPFLYDGTDRQTRHQILIKGGKKKSGASVKEGWTAKIFIPYKLLNPLNNISPEAGTEWRVNFYRVDYDRRDTSWWAWQPIDKSFHEYKKFGTLIFE